MTTTVFPTDDHILFRQGLALLVGKQAYWEIVGEANDGKETVQLAQSLRPQIAVLDVEMPRMDGCLRRSRHCAASNSTRPT